MGNHAMLVRQLKQLGVICLSHQCMRDYRHRFNLDGLAEIHHVIPRSLASHPILTAHGFDIHGPGNLALLPSTAGGRVLHLRSTRVIHTGGHPKYNRYVHAHLDGLDESPEALVRLLASLHARIRHDPHVPWN